MSFWAGVVQGVKDIDVLKGKEALAEERKAAGEEAKAYRDQMFEYNSRRDAAAEARAERAEALQLEDREWARAQTAALEVDAANAVLGGTRPSAASGGGGGGSVPAANDIKDSNIQLNGWVEAQLKDETLSPEDADYITGVVNSFTDPKDAHEFWTLYTGIRESTGQVPTVEQLRNTIRVTQVPGYADNRKQAEELLATIHGIDATTPEGLLKVRKLRKQLENIDLNAATIDADTSGYVTSEERPELYKDQAEIFETELVTNWLSENEQNAYENASPPAAAILMSRYRRQYGAQALSTLKSEYPREFREAQGNPAFRGIVSTDAATTTADNVGTGGGTPTTADSVGTEGGTPTTAPTPEDSPVTIAQKERRLANLLGNPDDPEAIAQANEVFGADEVARILENASVGGGTAREWADYERRRREGTPERTDTYREYQTPSENTEAPAGATELNLPKILEALSPETRKAVEAELNQRIGTVGFQDTGVRPAESKPQGAPEGPSDTNLERMEQSRLGRVEAESGRLSESESTLNEYIRPRMGATELNLPKILDALSPETRKIVEAELQSSPSDTNLERMEQARLGRVEAGSGLGATDAPLEPDEELAVGIEAIVAGFLGQTDPAELDRLIKELQAKYGEDAVRASLDLALNP